MPDHPTPDATPGDHPAKIGDLAAAAGLRRIHVLAWRDLDDVEAGGSEVHAAEVRKEWAEAGLDVTCRTSCAQGHPPAALRDGYQVVRKAGRYQVFPRTVAAELQRPYGHPDALVEIWNGMPFFSPLWATRPPGRLPAPRPRRDVAHGPARPAWPRMGDLLERRLAPPVYRRSRIITLSQSSREEMIASSASAPSASTWCRRASTPASHRGGARAPQPTIVAVGRLAPVQALRRARSGPPHQAASARSRACAWSSPARATSATTLEAVVAGLDADDWVELPGRVDDDELLGLYRRAWVLASASVARGLGHDPHRGRRLRHPGGRHRIAGHVDAVADGVSGLLADDPRTSAGRRRAAHRPRTPRRLARRRPPSAAGAFTLGGHRHPPHGRPGRRGRAAPPRPGGVADRR